MGVFATAIGIATFVCYPSTRAVVDEVSGVDHDVEEVDEHVVELTDEVRQTRADLVSAMSERRALEQALLVHVSDGISLIRAHSPDDNQLDALKAKIDACMRKLEADVDLSDAKTSFELALLRATKSQAKGDSEHTLSLLSGSILSAITAKETEAQKELDHLAQSKVEFFSLKGNAHFDLSEWEEARSCLLEVVKARPDDCDSERLMAAVCLTGMRREKEAIEELSGLLPDSNSTTSRSEELRIAAYANRAAAFRYLADTQHALQDFSQAILLLEARDEAALSDHSAKQFAKILTNRALLLEECKQFVKSERDSTRAIDLLRRHKGETQPDLSVALAAALNARALALRWSDLPKAKSQLVEAAAILKSLVEDQDYRKPLLLYCRVLGNLAASRIKDADEVSQSISENEKAIGLLEAEFERTGDREYQYELLIPSLNVAQSAAMEGTPTVVARAIAICNRGIRACRDLKSSRYDGSVNEKCAMIYAGRAMLHDRQGKAKQASSDFESSMQIITSENKTGKLQHKRELFMVPFNYAQHLKHDSARLGDSLKLIAVSMRIVGELIEEGEDDYRHMLPLLMNQRSEMRVSFHKAKIAEFDENWRSTRKKPSGKELESRFEHVRDHAFAVCEQALIKGQTAGHESAVDTCKAAIAEAESVNSRGVETRCCIATLLYAESSVLVASGRVKGALPIFTRATDIVAQLAPKGVRFDIRRVVAGVSAHANAVAATTNDHAVAVDAYERAIRTLQLLRSKSNSGDLIANAIVHLGAAKAAMKSQLEAD